MHMRQPSIVSSDLSHLAQDVIDRAIPPDISSDLESGARSCAACEDRKRCVEGAVRVWPSVYRAATVVRDMLCLPRQVASTIADLTIGTVIVLVHAAMADRAAPRAGLARPRCMVDGTRSWESQISP